MALPTPQIQRAFSISLARREMSIPIRQNLPRGTRPGITKLMNGIAEFVLRGGQGVTTSQMMEFSRKIPLLRLKVETMRDSGVPHLHDQTMFLARYAEDVLDGVYQSNDISAIMETVFALEYFFKGVDIIPDDVPEIGFKDDSAIVRTVLTGHEQEFRDFATANSLDFERLTLEA